MQQEKRAQPERVLRFANSKRVEMVNLHTSLGFVPFQAKFGLGTIPASISARGFIFWERKMKHQVDVHVGKRVRHRRWMVGMTQQQLGEAVGIKFQQIQKYETGMNRVSASRLWDIAAALGVPVSFFFEGLATDQVDGDVPITEAQGDLLADKEALELVRSYYAIPEAQRRRLFDLARVLSDAA
tara:strand:- start:627 stop:1178 length:552 start_codon:yes stop_codon:yes gene_type:complete